MSLASVASVTLGSSDTSVAVDLANKDFDNLDHAINLITYIYFVQIY
jgi:hypothetical protein